MCMPAAFEKIVSPFAAQVQDITDLPWARWKAREGVISSLAAYTSALRRVRVLIRVFTLIAPYIPNVIWLRRFWVAFCFSKELRHSPFTLGRSAWAF